MAATIRGMDELKARLKAVRVNAGQAASKEWAEECRSIMEQKVGGMTMPYAGKSKYPIRGSFRVKAGRMKKASLAHYTVVGSYHSFFVDHGVVSHSLAKRGKGQNRTVFAKKHPGYAARPFRLSSAIEALRRRPPMDQVIEAWNKAA